MDICLYVYAICMCVYICLIFVFFSLVAVSYQIANPNYFLEVKKTLLFYVVDRISVSWPASFNGSEVSFKHFDMN